MSNKLNINSFSDNTNNLIKNVNKTISTLNGISDTFTTKDEFVTLKMADDTNIQMPSYTNLLNRLKNVENTINAFTSGSGMVKLLDGTHRKVEVSTIPNVPQKIEGVTPPTTFKSNANWFFEDLIFPKLVVSIDLTNKIEEDSDRIKICRVIIPADNNIDFYINNIRDNNLSYNELTNLLSKNNINYYEDVDVINFPLSIEKYNGDFVITKTEIINGSLYYFLDNTLYGLNTENNTNVSKNINLKIGDTLRYKNTLYLIEEVDLSLNKVKMIAQVGMDIPSKNDTISIYVSPFATKSIDVTIGVDEINCIYFKGVNENYNLLSNDWSEPINFITNDLVNENNETLSYFYTNFVSDFGAEWISQAKERKIPAYKGIIPNTPVLDNTELKVVQINTHVNSSLNTEEITSTSSQIMALKSAISSSRDTIAKLKANLSNTSIQSERYEIQSLISNEESTLATNTSEYKSLVNNLMTQLKENSASITSPKYRIRGFFPIPEPKYVYQKNNNGEDVVIGKQEIIGFDIKYRYIRNDETGVELGTYSYLDGSTSISGVFTDWNIITPKIKEKVFDNELGIFVWKEENVGDGNIININQIDIPINDGEKVEIKVRSISEAGYPNCPIKSDWSKSVIVSFPSNLSTTNQLTNLLQDAKSDVISIQLDDVLKSAGYYNHISDETTSPSDNTFTYHHNSENIYFVNEKIENNNRTTNTISVSNMLKEIINSINGIKTDINSMQNNISDLQSEIKTIVYRIDKLEEKTNVNNN